MNFANLLESIIYILVGIGLLILTCALILLVIVMREDIMSRHVKPEPTNIALDVCDEDIDEWKQIRATPLEK